jgi:hypothetical protein
MSGNYIFSIHDFRNSDAVPGGQPPQQAAPSSQGRPVVSGTEYAIVKELSVYCKVSDVDSV